mgnify:CR=1 FL=1
MVGEIIVNGYAAHGATDFHAPFDVFEPGQCIQSLVQRNADMTRCK